MIDPGLWRTCDIRRLSSRWRNFPGRVVVVVLVRRLAVCLLLCGLLAGEGSSVASAAPPGPVLLTHDGYGELAALACPSAQQCTTDDLAGHVITFDPDAATSAGPVLSLEASLLVCPSVSQCTTLVIDPGPHPATEQYRAQLTFDPAGPLINAPVVINSTGEGGLACPSTTECLEASVPDAVFDPIAAAGATNLGVTSDFVQCPSVSECVTLDDTGGEVTLDPLDGSLMPRTEINPDWRSYGIGPLACPTTTQCTTFDIHGGVRTFDPLHPALAPRVLLDPHGGGVNWIACPAATQCTLIDADDGETTFNPADPRAASRVIIDPNGGPLIQIACPTTTQCTVIDATDSQITFNPQDPSTPTPYAAQAALVGVQAPAVGRLHLAPKLSFSVQAGDLSPADALSSLTILVPPSLRFDTRLVRRDLIVRGPDGSRLRVTTSHIGSRSLLITTSTPASQLNVTVASPGLTVAAGHLKGLQRHSTLTLALRTQTAGHAQATVPVTAILQRPRIPVCLNSNNYLPVTISNPVNC